MTTDSTRLNLSNQAFGGMYRTDVQTRQVDVALRSGIFRWSCSGAGDSNVTAGEHQPKCPGGLMAPAGDLDNFDHAACVLLFKHYGTSGGIILFQLPRA
jgi:hypothetical protein